MRSVAAYRALLVFYPKPFREEFGEDMVQLFQDSSRHGGRSALAVWARVIPDLLISSIDQRREWIMKNRTNWTVAGGALVTAAVYALVLVGVGGDIGKALIVFVVVSAVIGALLGISALVARRMQAPTEASATRRRSWWIPAPILLALYYVMVGGRPLLEGPSAKELFGVGVSLLFAGFIIFGLISRYRTTRSLGNWLIAVACLPALTVFWFPPSILVGLVGIIGSLSEVFAGRRGARAAA